MAIGSLAALTVLWASTYVLVLGEPFETRADSNLQDEECIDELSALQTSAALQVQQKLKGQEQDMESNATNNEHGSAVFASQNHTHSRHGDKDEQFKRHMGEYVKEISNRSHNLDAVSNFSSSAIDRVLDQGTEARHLSPSLEYLRNNTMTSSMPLSNSGSSSSLWNHWNIAFKVSVIEVAVLLVVILLRELGLAQEWFGQQDVGPDHRWYMRATEVGRIAFASCDYTFIIPLSLNLAVELGGSAIMSGFIVSSYSAGLAAGTLLSMKVMARHSRERKRRILVLALAFTGVSEAALAIVMTVPSLKGMAGLTVAIIGVRMMAGFASGWGSVHMLMLSQVCSPKEQTNFEAWLPCVDFIGLTSGPMLVAFCASTLQPVADYYMQAAPPLMCVAGLNMVISACLSFILPLDLDRVSCYQEQRPWLLQPAEYVNFEPDVLAAEAVDVLPNKNREALAVCFFLQVAACGFCTVGSELATPYIMEVSFGWNIIDIAIGLAVVFGCAGALSISLVLIRVRFGTGVDKRIGIPCCLLGIVATVLYFTGTFEGFANKYHYFIGDAVLYPCLSFVSGLMLSYAMWAANKDKWNHRENLVVTAQVTDAIVKFGGAPMVRGIIAGEGRLPYAIMQLVLAIFTLGDFLWARNVELWLDPSLLEESVPSGRGFFRELAHTKNKLLKPFRSNNQAEDDDNAEQ